MKKVLIILITLFLGFISVANLRADTINYNIILTEQGAFANNPGTQHFGSFSIDDSLLTGGPAVIYNPSWDFSVDIDGQVFQTSSSPFLVKIAADNIITLIGAQIDDTLGTTQLLLSGSSSAPPGEWILVGVGSNQGIYEVNAVPEPTSMLLLGIGLVGLAGFGRKKFKK